MDEKVLAAAMAEAVRIGMMPKQSTEETYLKNWENMRSVLEAAFKRDAARAFDEHKAPTSPGPVLSDLLGSELRNVLTKAEIDIFAGYWCEEIDEKFYARHENLGQFIQRVAQYAQDKLAT